MFKKNSSDYQKQRRNLKEYQKELLISSDQMIETISTALYGALVDESLDKDQCQRLRRATTFIIANERAEIYNILMADLTEEQRNKFVRKMIEKYLVIFEGDTPSQKRASLEIKLIENTRDFIQSVIFDTDEVYQKYLKHQLNLFGTFDLSSYLKVAEQILLIIPTEIEEYEELANLKERLEKITYLPHPRPMDELEVYNLSNEEP